jgi:hypothetical protein
MSEADPLEVVEGELVEPTAITPAPPKPREAPVEVRAWERQDDETPTQYAAFCVYLDLPLTKRSIAAVARAQGVRVRPREMWAKKNRWKERALAYDRHMAEMERGEVERLQVDLARRRVLTASRLIDRAARDVHKTTRTLRPFEAARILEVSTRLGEPADMAAKSGSGVTLENVVIAIAEARRDSRTITD